MQCFNGTLLFLLLRNFTAVSSLSFSVLKSVAMTFSIGPIPPLASSSPLAMHLRQDVNPSSQSTWCFPNAMEGSLTRVNFGNKKSIGWRSFTLRAPYLLCMTILLIILIAVLEYLSHQSARDGGVTFADKEGQYSILQNFSFLYLPTIITVSLSLAWSWIDLDVKRLEPYFQLSKSTGARAERSILLQYPNEYLPLVPLRALRYRYMYPAISSKIASFLINKRH